MLRVDFPFTVSKTDLAIVLLDDSSLLIGVQVWSRISMMWLLLSLTFTDAMALHVPPVELTDDEFHSRHSRPVKQRQVEVPWNFRVNFCPSNNSPFRPRIVVAVLETPNDSSAVWGL